MIEEIKHTREYKYINPRRIVCIGKYNTISEDVVEGQEIFHLVLDDEEIIEPRVIHLSKGYKDIFFRCNKITVDRHNPILKRIELSLYYTHLNKVSGYLLPTLFDIHQVGAGAMALLYDKNYVNAYIKVEDSDLDGSIYLLYKYDGSLDMLNLEEWLTRQSFYVETIHPDKYHTLYHLKVEDKDTYSKFINSDFSKFNESHKVKLEKFFGLKKEELKYQIIHNSDILRNKMENELGVVIPKHVSLIEKINIEELTYRVSEMAVE